jgi:hypothetical protein
MLPNFICLGAQKSGTTTLLEQLRKHPDVFMSPSRETRFFLQDYLYSQGTDAYEMEFFSDWDGQKAAGEKTPEYLCDPLVPGRIRDSLGPDMRFIVTLRSPAQRAYAQYRQNFQFLRETVGFDEALELEAERCNRGRYQRLRFGYAWRGRYAEQLDRYLALYPKARFFFAIYERDIVMRQAETLKAIFRFLGVDPAFDPGSDVSAGRARPLVPRILETDGVVELPGFTGKARAGDILLTRAGIKPRVIRRPSDSLLMTAQAALKHAPQDTSLPRALELELNHRYFKDDILRLQELLESELDLWLK